MVRKILLSIVLIIGIATATYAQDYDTGLGLRGGTSWGISAKHFISRNNALEGFLYGHNHGFNVTGLYEFHNMAFEVDYLRWYYGFGGHIGSYDYDTTTEKDNFVIGIDGIVGIEYTFTEAPINIGIDWNPYINFTGKSGFLPGNVAISIRYVF